MIEINNYLCISALVLQASLALSISNNDDERRKNGLDNIVTSFRPESKGTLDRSIATFIVNLYRRRLSGSRTINNLKSGASYFQPIFLQ